MFEHELAFAVLRLHGGDIMQDHVNMYHIKEKHINPSLVEDWRDVKSRTSFWNPEDFQRLLSHVLEERFSHFKSKSVIHYFSSMDMVAEELARAAKDYFDTPAWHLRPRELLVRPRRFQAT